MVSASSSAAFNAASWSSSMAPSTACSASLLQGAWRPAYSRSAVEDAAGDTDVIPGRSLPFGVAQQRGGVVRDDHRNPAEPVHPVPQCAERLLGVEKRLGRGAPHGENHPRTDQFELAEQVRDTGLNLVEQGRAILRRPALDHVADEHLLS